jgi:hypothetical protein
MPGDGRNRSGASLHDSLQRAKRIVVLQTFYVCRPAVKSRMKADLVTVPHPHEMKNAIRIAPDGVVFKLASPYSAPALIRIP